MVSPKKSEGATLVAKKGRGRPRSPHALTPAQRAKRYRDRKRAQQDSVDKNSVKQVRGATLQRNIDALRAENARLTNTLEAARNRINDLIGALELFVDARANNRKISREQMQGLHKLLALGDLPDTMPAAKKAS